MHLGLTYRSSTSFPGQPDMLPNTLWGYVDSDWTGCPDTRKSTSAYVFMLNGAAISWRSKRQTMVALSMAEAEYISLQKKCVQKLIADWEPHSPCRVEHVTKTLQNKYLAKRLWVSPSPPYSGKKACFFCRDWLWQAPEQITSTGSAYGKSISTNPTRIQAWIFCTRCCISKSAFLPFNLPSGGEIFYARRAPAMYSAQRRLDCQDMIACRISTGNEAALNFYGTEQAKIGEYVREQLRGNLK